MKQFNSDIATPVPAVSFNVPAIVIVDGKWKDTYYYGSASDLIESDEPEWLRKLAPDIFFSGIVHLLAVTSIRGGEDLLTDAAKMIDNIESRGYSTFAYNLFSRELSDAKIFGEYMSKTNGVMTYSRLIGDLA